MNEYVSLQKIITLFEDYQQSQENIGLNGFGYGNIVDFGLNLTGGTQAKYPFMFVTPQNIAYNENITTYTMSIIFADRINDDKFNLVDVQSDMSIQAKRFMSWIRRGMNQNPNLYDNMEINLPVTGLPFLERFNDYVGGISIDAEIVVFEDINACDYYDFTITPSPTPTPSITPTITPTPTLTSSPTPTPTITPSSSPAPLFIPISATGGTETTYVDGGITYKVHTFTGGTTNFDVISTGTTGQIDYLLVAGGGGGGGSTSAGSGGGGGGGAGGLLTGSTILSTINYSIVVGDGGLGVSNTSIANNGQNTTAFGFTAIGGGGGSSSLNRSGASGGSGGGAAARTTTTWIGGSATIGQGFSGGTPTISSTRPGAGGGGGASQEGQIGAHQGAGDYNGGDGGDGLLVDINGTPTYYAGGGGGSIWNNFGLLSGGTGGIGGGGNAALNNTPTIPAQDGQPNTGGGGGGGGNLHKGGDGGSGIVIIRYPLNI